MTIPADADADPGTLAAPGGATDTTSRDVRIDFLYAGLPFVGLAFVGGLISSLGQGVPYPPWATMTLPTLVTGGLLAALMLRRRGTPSFVGVQAALITCLVWTFLHPVIYEPTGPATAWPPFFNFFLLGGGVAAAMLPSAWGVAAGAILAGWVAWTRIPAVGTGSALGEGATGAILLITPVVVRMAVQGAVTQQRRSVALAHAAAVQQARVERRRDERERWNGILHDKVLGALNVVIRATGDRVPTAARELAEAAQRELGNARCQERSPVLEAMREMARARGLALRLDIEGPGAPHRVEEVLLGAAACALDNVQRHADVREVEVSGTLGQLSALLEIRDGGRGFDVEAVPGHRLGIRQGMVDRLASVGGTAEVHSAPGAGTRVVLSWADRAAAPALTPWPRRAIAATGALMFCLPYTYLATDIVEMGRLHPLNWVAALIGCPVAAAVLLLTPRSWRPYRYGVAALTLAFPFLLQVVAVAEGPRGNAGWTLGMAAVMCAVLAFRDQIASALAYAAGFVVSLEAGSLLVHHVIDEGAEVFPALVGTALAARMLRTTLVRHAEATHRAAWAVAQAQAAAMAEQERALESDRRLAHFGDAAREVLERIAAGGAVTRAFRRECVLVEGSLRDSLAASPVMVDELATAARSARSRGVTVALGAEAAELGLVGPFVWTATAVLDAARAGDEVHAFWQPSPRLGLGFVTFVGPCAERELPEHQPGDVGVTVDEDHAIYEFNRPASPARLAG